MVIIVSAIIISDGFAVPETEGIQATKRIVQKNLALEVITSTSFTEGLYLKKMVVSGVGGEMVKRSDPEDLEIAIKRVVERGSIFSDDIIEVITHSLYKNIERNTKRQFEERPSSREKQFLSLVCKGSNNEQSAYNIHLSPKTI